MFDHLSSRPYINTSQCYTVRNRLVAQFLIKDLMPLSTVEGEGYNLPCRKTILETQILPLYDITKSAVQTKLSNMADRICFTSDAWSSLAEDRYMSLTAHYINNETFVLEHFF